MNRITLFLIGITTCSHAADLTIAVDEQETSAFAYVEADLYGPGGAATGVNTDPDDVLDSDDSEPVANASAYEASFLANALIEAYNAGEVGLMDGGTTQYLWATMEAHVCGEVPQGSNLSGSAFSSGTYSSSCRLRPITGAAERVDKLSVTFKCDPTPNTVDPDWECYMEFKCGDTNLTCIYVESWIPGQEGHWEIYGHIGTDNGAGNTTSKVAVDDTVEGLSLNKTYTVTDRNEGDDVLSTSWSIDSEMIGTISSAGSAGSAIVMDNCEVGVLASVKSER